MGGQGHGHLPSFPVSFLGGGASLGGPLAYFGAPSGHFGSSFGAPSGPLGAPGAAIGLTPSMATYFEQQLQQQRQLTLLAQQAKYFKYLAAQQFGESICGPGF